MSEHGDDATPATTDWTAVTHCPTRADAEIVASALRGNGLEVRILSDDGGGMLPQLDAVGRGISIEVPATDAPTARSLLEQDAVPDDVLEAEALREPFTGGASDRESGHTPALLDPPDIRTDPETSGLVAGRSSGPWRSLFVILVVLGVALALATVFLDLGS